MRTVYLLRGLPASAKSSFARDLMKREPNRWKRFCRDDLRAMIDNNSFNSDNEDFIRQVHNRLIRTALMAGFDVIIDGTHLVPQTLKKLHHLIESIGDCKVIEKCFNISIAEAKRRNALREGAARVPDRVIEGMAKGAGIDRGRVLEDKEFYYPPKEQRVYEANKELPEAVICDLDGTLSLLNGRNPYDASTCDQDLPNTPVIECVKAMYATGRKIIFMSGREDQYRAQTEKFIAKHLPDMPYELYMRKTGDSRKDSIIKSELFDAHIRERFNVLFNLDDRQQVVDFYRSMGLAVFQVDYGDF